MHPTRVLLAICGLVLGVLGKPSPDFCSQILKLDVKPGFPKTIKTNDPDVLRAARHSAESFNNCSNDAFLFRESRVSRALVQIVKGLKFMLDMDIGRTTCKKTGHTNLDDCGFQTNRTLQWHIESSWRRDQTPPGSRPPRCPSSTATDCCPQLHPCCHRPRKASAMNRMVALGAHGQPGPYWDGKPVCTDRPSPLVQVTRVLNPKGLPSCPEVPGPQRKPKGPSFRLNNHPSTGQGLDQLSHNLQGEHLGINLNKELTPLKLCLVLDPMSGELEKQLTDGRARCTGGHGRNPGPSARAERLRTPPWGHHN